MTSHEPHSSLIRDSGNQGDKSHGNQGDSSHGNQGDSSHGNQGDKSHGNQGDSSHGNQGDSSHGNQGDSSYGNQGDKSHEPVSQHRKTSDYGESLVDKTSAAPLSSQVAPLNEYECSDCHVFFHTQNALINHKVSGCLTKTFQCSYCDKAFNSPFFLTSHERLHRGEAPFSCFVCGEGFTDHGVLQDHLKVHDSKVEKEGCESSNVNSGSESSSNTSINGGNHGVAKEYGCDKCHLVFRFKHLLSRHQLIHDDPNPECAECGSQFATWSDLQRHMVLAHGSNSNNREPIHPFHCTVCQKTFTTKLKLHRHEVVHGKRKLFSCTVCDSSYLHKDNLKRHMFTVHSDSRHPCDSGGKTVTHSDGLAHHQTSTCRPSSRDPGNTSISTGASGTASPGVRHERKQSVDTEDTPRPKLNNADISNTELNLHSPKGSKLSNCKHAWKKCDEKFPTCHQLAKHMTVHKRALPQASVSKHREGVDGEKKYKCDNCVKCYTNNGDLMRHMHSHNTVRAHKCTVCGAGFHYSTYLKRHMSVHSGKVFQCDLCPRNYSRADSLRNHKNIHLLPELFQCAICDRKFHTLRRLKYHVSSVHSTKKTPATKSAKRKSTISSKAVDTTANNLNTTVTSPPAPAKAETVSSTPNESYTTSQLHPVEEPSTETLDTPPTCNTPETQTPATPPTYPSMQQMPGGYYNAEPTPDTRVSAVTDIPESSMWPLYPNTEGLVNLEPVYNGHLSNSSSLPSCPSQPESSSVNTPDPIATCLENTSPAEQISLENKSQDNGGKHGTPKRRKSLSGNQNNKKLKQRSSLATKDWSFVCGVCDRISHRKHNLKRHCFTQHKGAGFEAYETSSPDISKPDLATEAEISVEMESSPETEVSPKAQSSSEIGQPTNVDANLDVEMPAVEEGEFNSEHGNTDSSNLMKHKNIKPGNSKTYECGVCGNSYAHSHGLTRHMAKHSTVLPYGCDLCEKRFARKDHRRSHEKTHSSEKPHKCDVCGASFTAARYLTRHRKDRHGKVTPNTN